MAIGFLGQAPPMSSSPAPPADGLERRVIWLVAMVQLVNVLDFVMVMPLGRDFARALAIDESQLGLIGGSYTLAAAIAGLVSSRFLDRFDRRSALIVSMLGLVTATAAGGLARDLPTLMAARILAGMFGGPATSLSMAIIADVVPPARRGAAMSVVMAASSVASVIGVPLGLYAAQLGSWRTPFFALALLRRPEMTMTLAAAAAMTWSVFMIVPYVRSFLQNNHHVADGDIKFLYLIGGIASFAVVRVTGPTVDRIGSTPVATLGTVLVTAALLVGFLPAEPILPVMLVFSLFMCTASLRGVPLSALSSKLPAPHERAQYMSLQSAVQHLASSAGAITASRIVTTDATGRLHHVDIVVFASIAFAVCMPILMWSVERRVRAGLVAPSRPVELPEARVV